jgi:hypothetical protein
MRKKNMSRTLYKEWKTAKHKNEKNADKLYNNNHTQNITR